MLFIKLKNAPIKCERLTYGSSLKKLLLPLPMSISHLIQWLAFAIILTTACPSNTYATENSNIELNQAIFESPGVDPRNVTLPHYFHADYDLIKSEQFIYYTIKLHLAEKPEQPLGIYASHISRAGKVFINDAEVGNCASGPVKAIRCGDSPSIFFAPTTVWKKGENTITFKVAPTSIHMTGLSLLSIGPAIHMMEKSYIPRMISQLGFATLLGLTLVFIGAAFLFIAKTLEDQRLTYIAISAICQGLFRASAIVWNTPINVFIFEKLIVAISISSGVMFYYGIALHFDINSKPLKTVTKILIWSQPLIILLPGLDNIRYIATYIPTYLFASLVLIYCTQRAIQSKRTLDALLIVSMIFVEGGALRLLTDQMGLTSIDTGFKSLYFFIIPLAIISGLVLTLVSAKLQDIVQLSKMLKIQVVQNEVTLANGTIKLVESQRGNARQEERESIMRDMHDGLGSTLLGAKIRVQRGETDPTEISQILEDCIDELRLVLNSSADESSCLQSAIADFQHRTQSRLEGSDIETLWQIDIPPNLLNSSSSLDTLRILQEALTNAIRHSGASVIHIRAAIEETNTLFIEVEDNGSTESAKTRISSGRGQYNMQTRAQKLGGNLTIAQGSKGTKVTFQLGLNLSNQEFHR